MFYQFLNVILTVYLQLSTLRQWHKFCVVSFICFNISNKALNGFIVKWVLFFSEIE